MPTLLTRATIAACLLVLLLATGAPASSPTRPWYAAPVKRPALPRVRNGAWVRTPIDAFILAGLESRGLSPSPPADRRALIRRAT